MPVPGTLAKWNQDLASAIAAIGSHQFFCKLVAAINNRVPVDYPQVWLYHTELPPQCVYHEIPTQPRLLRSMGTWRAPTGKILSTRYPCHDCGVDFTVS